LLYLNAGLANLLIWFWQDCYSSDGESVPLHYKFILALIKLVLAISFIGAVIWFDYNFNYFIIGSLIAVANRSAERYLAWLSCFCQVVWDWRCFCSLLIIFK
jgi:hypothetical protein